MSFVADDFIPVRPIPPKTAPHALELFMAARRDLLSIWDEKCYRAKFLANKHFNQWVFIANSPDTVKHVFVTHNDNYERKSPYMRRALEPLLGDGLFVSDGATWKTRREMLAPAFRNVALYGGAMTGPARETRQRWESMGDGAALQVLPEMAKLTAEIISRAMFGNELGQERAQTIVDGFSEYQAGIEHIDLSTFFGLPKWLSFTPQWKKVTQAGQRIHQVVDGIIEQEKKERRHKDTLLSMLLDARDETSGRGLTDVQARNEAIVIFMAGHETTANSLAWSWYLLSQHSRVEDRLHEELDRVLAGRLPDCEDVANLTYTRAVFEEAMRLYPPVPILSRQCLNDDVIRERPVPAGSIILVVPWLLHRHEQYWEKPHHFVPERFTGEWSQLPDKHAYIPFSAGPRFCLGAAFGLTEAVLCLATLAQRFKLQLKPGHEAGYDCRLTLRPSGGLPMILRDR